MTCDKVSTVDSDLRWIYLRVRVKFCPAMLRGLRAYSRQTDTRTHRHTHAHAYTHRQIAIMYKIYHDNDAHRKRKDVK